MDWYLFKDNIEYFARNTNSRISFMSAFNILSLPTFKNFLIWILHLKTTYYRKHREDHRIKVDIPYVRNPGFLDVKVASEELVKTHLIPAVDFMIENTNLGGFGDIETAKLKRIIADVLYRFKNKEFKEEQRQSQKLFYKFVNEYDKRRDLNFVKTFPEYKEFYKEIKNA